MKWINIKDEKPPKFHAGDKVWVKYQYGRMWAGNGENGSLVKYCPFCGEKGTE